MNYYDLKKLQGYVSGVPSKPVEMSAMDEMFGRKHADGTPCKAQSPETCPFNQKAEEGEHLENAEKPEGGVSSKEDSWEKRIRAEREKRAAQDPTDPRYVSELNDEEFEKLNEDLGNRLYEAKCSFLDLDVNGFDIGIGGGLEATFRQNVEESDSDIGFDKDGRMCVITSLMPGQCRSQIDDDLKAAAEALGDAGLSFEPEDESLGKEEYFEGFDQANVRSEFDSNYRLKYYADRTASFRIKVSDPEKWKAFVGQYKGTIKEDEEEW